MSDRVCVMVRQCLLLALVVCAMLILSRCTKVATPEGTPTSSTTPDDATLVPSRTSVPTAEPSATRATEAAPSVTPLPTVVVSASATPSALPPTVTGPTPTRVQPGTYVISDVVLSDGAHGRLYAQGRVGEQDKTLVLSATDGGLLSAYDYTGALGLDAEHRWLYVDAAGTDLVILNADTGERLGEVVLPPQEGYQPRAVPPQADPAQGQVLAFRQNVVHVADGASGRVVRTIPFEFEKAGDCRTDEGPYPIEWAAYDPSARILYVSYLSYVCTPWFGFGIISYDLDSGEEIAHGGDYAFQATAAGGWLYGSSWHRFGIGYLWAWRDGEPWLRSSDWNSKPRFAVDEARKRLYGDLGGSLGVLDAQSMDLLFTVPWPHQGQFSGFDSVADTLYFVADGQLRLWPASHITKPMAGELLATSAPTMAVDALVVSPDWPSDSTLVGIWGRAQPMDQCYAFAQQGGTLLLSSDGGRHWTEPSAGLPACRYVACLTVSPDFARDHTLLAGVLGLGVFRTTDGGRLWEPASVGLGSMNVQELILSPSFALDQAAFARVGTGGPYRSTDGGQTWEALDLTPSPVEQLLLSPGFADDRTLLAQLSSGALYRSRDAGRTWQDLGVARRPVVLSPEFDRDGIILGAAPDSTDLYISRDSGSSWERVGSTPESAPTGWLSLAPLFAKWGVAFARGRDNGALYRTSDAGLTWRQLFLESGEPLAIAAGAAMTFLYAPDVEENRPVYLLATEEDYSSMPPTKRGLLYRSGDGGTAWRRAQLPQDVVPTTLVVSPGFAADRLVFIGTADGRVLMLPDDTL